MMGVLLGDLNHSVYGLFGFKLCNEGWKSLWAKHFLKVS